MVAMGRLLGMPHIYQLQLYNTWHLLLSLVTWISHGM